MAESTAGGSGQRGVKWRMSVPCLIDVFHIRTQTRGDRLVIDQVITRKRSVQVVVKLRTWFLVWYEWEITERRRWSIT